MSTGVDCARTAASEAMREFLRHHHTNAIGSSVLIEAMDLVLDAYEDELYRGQDVYLGWAVMQGVSPVIVLPNKRSARYELKSRRRANGGRGAWRIERTEMAWQDRRAG